jgi:hypothetical protein
MGRVRWIWVCETRRRLETRLAITEEGKKAQAPSPWAIIVGISFRGVRLLQIHGSPWTNVAHRLAS